MKPRPSTAVVFFLVISLVVIFAARPAAAFVSPGTGVTYTLATLDAACAEVTVVGTSYFRISGPVTISANDTLNVAASGAGRKMTFDPGVKLTILGTLTVTGTSASKAIIKSSLTSGTDNFRIEVMAPLGQASFNYANLSNGKVLTSGGRINLLTFINCSLADTPVAGE